MIPRVRVTGADPAQRLEICGSGPELTYRTTSHTTVTKEPYAYSARPTDSLNRLH